MIRVYFYPDMKRYVLFTAPVLEHIYSHAQLKSSMPEAGGEVFSIAPDADGLVISSIAGPTSRDKRTRTSWVPNAKAADKNRKSEFLNGKHVVGLWHTHPENNPAPSNVDRCTTFDYLRTFESNRSRYFMIILGNEGNPLKMAVWVATITGRRERWMQLYEVRDPVGSS
ncbi:Mov34/MPN/PAD-1 family protein [Achromobacter ruhlandii]|uniref:Mov34/MPN/PAD-1 family protein n=1 Tax=Achromobacter ruhlandii TaxID=72557 RepID=UPI0009ECD0B3|nr:Mov34/MPN/PAD-1 family protein [Achromobacter ruhlandii]